MRQKIDLELDTDFSHFDSFQIILSVVLNTATGQVLSKII